MSAVIIYVVELQAIRNGYKKSTIIVHLSKEKETIINVQNEQMIGHFTSRSDSLDAESAVGCAAQSPLWGPRVAHWAG